MVGLVNWDTVIIFVMHALMYLCFAIMKMLKVAFQFADYCLKRTDIEIDDM